MGDGAMAENLVACRKSTQNNHYETVKKNAGAINPPVRLGSSINPLEHGICSSSFLLQHNPG